MLHKGKGTAWFFVLLLFLPESQWFIPCQAHSRGSDEKRFYSNRTASNLQMKKPILIWDQPLSQDWRVYRFRVRMQIHAGKLLLPPTTKSCATQSLWCFNRASPAEPPCTYYASRLWNHPPYSYQFGRHQGTQGSSLLKPSTYLFRIFS